MATPQTLKLLLDNFNRSNEGPPPSNSWTNGISTFTAGEGAIVLSNQLVMKTGGGLRQGSYWSAADFGPNVELVLECSEWTNAANAETRLWCSLQQIGVGTTDGYFLQVNRSPGNTVDEWYLVRSDNLSLTFLVGPTTQNIDATDFICLQRIGSALSGWYRTAAGSWTLIVSATDATYAAAGKVGVEFAESGDAQVHKWTNMWAATLPAGSQTFVALRP